MYLGFTAHQRSRFLYRPQFLILDLVPAPDQAAAPLNQTIMDSVVLCQDLQKFLGKFVNMRSSRQIWKTPIANQEGGIPSCKHLDERGLIPSHSASRVRLLLGVLGVKWGIFPLHLNLCCQWGELLHKGLIPLSPHMPMECWKIRIKS